MPIFAASWTLHPEKRSDAYTFFSSLDDAGQKANLGPGMKEIGRFHCMNDCTGVFIGEATSANAMMKFLWNWSEDMAECTCEPVLDDNGVTELILGHKPTWTRQYDPYEPARDGETLYMARYQFDDCASKVKAYDNLAKMTKEEDAADHGDCRRIGAWHNIPKGSGYVIYAAKSNYDAIRWPYNWASLAKIEIMPVITNKEAQKIVKEKEGYDYKFSTVMSKMGMVM